MQPLDDLMSALVDSHGEDEEPLTMAELQNVMHQLITEVSRLLKLPSIMECGH